MIEVVFSNSAEGALRYAQGWGDGPYRPSCFGFVLEENETPSRLKLWLMQKQYQRREKKKWKNAVVLPGKGEDVFGLSLGLSMGNIAPDHFWNSREAFFTEKRLWDLPADAVNQAKQAAQRELEKVRNNLSQIYKRAHSGEPLRIWLGTSGEDLCMLAWFAAQLEQHQLTSARVYLNQLPEKYNLPQGGAVSWSDWGEVGPAEWGILDRALRREAPAEFLSEQAAVWHRLQSENTQLRIVENGIIRSVPQDYYDGLIQAELDRQPNEFHEARLIGSLVGSQLRMPDTWIAGRIEPMIASGRLLITWEETPGSLSYRRRLKKVPEKNSCPADRT